MISLKEFRLIVLVITNTKRQVIMFKVKSFYPMIGDGAKWLLETIDDTNYFGVTCLTSPDVKDAEGNWYTTAYFDFPFTVNNGDAYYISKTTADKTNNIYTATATKIDGTVPAQTPVLLKVKGSDAASNKLTPVYQETEDAAISNNLLKGGVYADAGKTGTINDLYDGGTLNVSFFTLPLKVCLQPTPLGSSALPFLPTR
jgi:hypothetical protein